MRPLEKGKNSKTFGQYQKAKPDLIDKLGEYCSYCERKLPVSLAVEHVQPRSLRPDLILKWENFLLACANCNSNKLARDIRLKDYLWPDRDNTFLAFVYREGGVIAVNDKLDKKQKKCAQNILDLIGLQKRPGANDLNKRDMRWMQRLEAWNTAIDSLNDLLKNDTEILREYIVKLAQEKGFWSIWMTVFKDDIDMLKRFIEMFPGTCRECFDGAGAPISRKGGIV